MNAKKPFESLRALLYAAAVSHFFMSMAHKYTKYANIQYEKYKKKFIHKNLSSARAHLQQPRIYAALSDVKAPRTCADHQNNPLFVAKTSLHADYIFFIYIKCVRINDAQQTHALNEKYTKAKAREHTSNVY